MRKLIEFTYVVFLAGRSRLLVWYFKNFHDVTFGRKVRIYAKLLIHGPGKVEIGERTFFSSRRAINEIVTIHPDAEVRIGRRCSLNGAIIGAARSITIGDDCIIAEAYIRDTSSHGIAPNARRDPAAAKVAPVVLENNVWVGSQVHVMPGVTIGENSVIGANAVVTKSIPKNVFAAGNPARVIRSLVSLDSSSEGSL